MAGTLRHPRYPFHESSEVHEAYLSAKEWRQTAKARKIKRGRGSRFDSSAHVDPLTEIKIGGARTEALRDEITDLFPRCLWIAIILAELLGERPLTDRPKEEQGNEIPVRVHSDFESTAEEMTDPEGPVHLLEPKPQGWTEWAMCGLFAVHKKIRTVLRVIFDARPANRLLNNSAVRLVFFTLDQLLLTFAFLARLGVVYTLSIDWRAYYYQLRCPEQVKRHCVIRLLDKLWVPRALPMGLHASCTWGQGHSWALVLRRGKGASSLGILDSDVEGEEMPRMLWLYEGLRYSPGDERHDKSNLRKIGAIFVQMDGVFVMTLHQGLRDAWDARLRENEKRFHIVRKEDSAEKGDSVTATVFSGIEFASEKGWRVHNPKPLATSVRTCREAQSVVGALHWDLRVSRHNMLDEEDFLELASRLGKTASEGGWDSGFVFSKTEGEAVKRLIKIRADRKWIAIPREVAFDEVALAASDAMPTGLGYCIFDERGAVADFGPKREAWKVPEDAQAIQELKAVVELAKRVAVPNKLVALVAGVDADTARVVLEKGCSRSREMRVLLRQLRAEAPGVRVFPVRVPGVKNCADGPSRGQPPQADRVATTFRIVKVYSEELNL